MLPFRLAVLAEGKRVLINNPKRFGGVKVIGVDEHVWRPPAAGTGTSLSSLT